MGLADRFSLLVRIAGVFRCTNDGSSWVAVNSGLTDTLVKALAMSGPNLFAGTDSGGVFLSTNFGNSWAPVSSGLTNLVIHSLAIGGASLFAATDNGVWIRPLSEMTGVKLGMNEIPEMYSLTQNYPNPFNPSTTISFDLPSRSYVTLKVFDIIGREVSTIVSGEFQAGSYTRQWNAAKMASGVYFYRLTAGNFVNTKKLLLLK